ncbi:MAG: hypothetical protein HY901_07700 [Deltaproteobacteria bacterium]|nr:hypothetical protein [Deltaproteobacteria bacterium]
MAIGPRIKSVTTTATARDVMVVKCQCERCKTTYSYEKGITAAVSVSAQTMSQAAGDAGGLRLGAALALAERRSEVVQRSEVGSQACPKCGYYQSYMAEDAADLHARMLSWLPTLLLIAVGGQRGCAAVMCSSSATSDAGGDTRALQTALFFAAALVTKYVVQLLYRPWWLAGWKQHRVRTTLKPEVSWKSEQKT